MEVKSNLHNLCKEKGVSIRKLSEDIGWGFETVRKLYNDEMERYPRDLIGKLCDYFGVDPGKIFIYEKKEDPE